MLLNNPVPQIALYRRWLEDNGGRSFADYEALWRWSVTDLEGFWRSIWAYDKLESPTPFEKALAVDQMPGAVWFSGAKVNYARQILRHVEAAEAAGQPAIVAENEAGEVSELGWFELRQKAAALAVTLREYGLRSGDRVAAILPNTPETVIAFLACSSLGAIWSLCAPDMGLPAVIDRFAQIEPKVLIAADGVHYAGKSLDRSDTIDQLRIALPTVEIAVIIDTPYATRPGRGELRFAEVTARHDETVAAFEPEWLDFGHPLWILYSSGTTGLPKPIVHGHGGLLLAAMTNAKHKDLGASYDTNTFGERYHWFTSTGWVMWNAQVEGLLGGTTICLYDGSPSGSKSNPDWGVLWRFAARHGVTFFGSGAAFYANCLKAGLELRDCGDLSHIRALGSTGSPLSEDVQRWGTAQFASIASPEIWWCNLSGGTDLGGGFCTGNRELPLIPGQMQCRQLGSAVEAWDEAGEAVIDQVGELVCTRPSPGMPLFLWNDPGDQRYLASYFERFPGVWRQGDWIRITPAGQCIIYGRSDATINRHGVRMGTSEIYAAVEALPEVLDSLVLDLQAPGRPGRLVLFVVLQNASVLDDDLRAAIGQSIRTNLSPRFVPDDIIEAPEIPRTLSGKKQEVPMKRLFLGHEPGKVINPATMANPQALDWFMPRIADWR